MQILEIGTLLEIPGFCFKSRLWTSLPGVSLPQRTPLLPENGFENVHLLFQFEFFSFEGLMREIRIKPSKKSASCSASCSARRLEPAIRGGARRFHGGSWHPARGARRRHRLRRDKGRARGRARTMRQTLNILWQDVVTIF